MSTTSNNQPPGQSHDDLTALQGDWEQVAMEADGLSDPPDFHGAPGAITTFSGHRFDVRAVTGESILSGTFTLDASMSPRSITWVDSVGEDAGKRLPASYRLDGDAFVFIAGNEGEPRPTEFSTVPGQTMRSFVRKR
jgi:uncharacterized protein (TIGR03067 family)